MELINATTAGRILGVSGSTLKRWHDTGEFVTHLSSGGLRVYDAHLIWSASQLVSEQAQLNCRSKSYVLEALNQPTCLALYGSHKGVYPNNEKQRNIIMGFCKKYGLLPSFDLSTFPENPKRIVDRVKEIEAKTLITGPLSYFSRDQIIITMCVAHKLNLTLITVNDKSMTTSYDNIAPFTEEDLCQS